MAYDSVASFLRYFEGIHARTERLYSYIPEDKLEWRLSENQFGFGDLYRHLASVERHMFVAIARGEPSVYRGHSREITEGFDSLKAYYDALHIESVELLGQLDDSDLQARCVTPAGVSMRLWKWLRAMVEHEVHHRGQIYMMLGMLDVQTPPIFGLTSEQLKDSAEEK